MLSSLMPLPTAGLAFAGTLAAALPTDVAARGNRPTQMVDRIVCMESSQVQTALCANDAATGRPVMEDCHKLAEKTRNTIAAIQSNAWETTWSFGYGKCRSQIASLQDPNAAGGAVIAQYDRNVIAQWITDQSQACFGHPEFNVAHCTLASPMAVFKLSSGDA